MELHPLFLFFFLFCFDRGIAYCRITYHMSWYNAPFSLVTWISRIQITSMRSYHLLDQSNPNLDSTNTSLKLRCSSFELLNIAILSPTHTVGERIPLRPSIQSKRPQLREKRLNKWYSFWTNNKNTVCSIFFAWFPAPIYSSILLPLSTFMGLVCD